MAIIRLMSNNIWNCDANKPAWEAMGEDCSAKARMPGIARVYAETKPDVIGLQEASHTMVDLLVHELEKLGAEEKKLQDKLSLLENDLTEAQRSLDQVQFQITAASDQLREAEDQVLRLQGQEKQHEILLGAITDAANAARAELEALQKRAGADRERHAAQQAKIQIFTAQLEQTRQRIALLEDSQSEANESSARLTEQMTALRTEAAALEAEGQTARTHIADAAAAERSRPPGGYCRRG